MAAAIAAGLNAPFLITDSGSGRAAQVAQQHGGTPVGDNARLAESCDVIFLCAKPAQLDAVAVDLAGYGGIVVSALAATPAAVVAAAFPQARTVRIMPNTPVEHGAGVICVSDASDQAAVEQIRDLLEQLGRVERVAEYQMELATAIGGCAPAFFALLAQRLAQAATERGMSDQQARRIVGLALAGTGTLTGPAAYDYDTIKRAVASPGGLTEKALARLDESGLERAVADAVDAVLGSAG